MAEIRSNHSEMLMASSAEKDSMAGMELKNLIQDTNGDIQQCRQALKRLGVENRKNKGDFAETRIRNNMHMVMSRKFQDLLAEYQAIQAEYKNKAGKANARQVKTVNPEATPEALDAALNSGQVEAVFANATMLSPAHQIAKFALQDAYEQNQEVREVEVGVVELHNMMLDMANVVDRQGDVLQQIEFSVNASMRYADDGVNDLKSASEYQKAAGKKMMVCGIILLIGGAGVAVAMFAF